VDHFKREFHVEVDITHQPLLVSENYNDYPFMRCQNIGSTFFHFVAKHAFDRQTDKQTDRITITKTAVAWLLRVVKTIRFRQSV